MSGFVVDASVAVKWFVPEEFSDQADELSASGARLVAPRLIMTELANAFFKKVRANLMKPADAASDLAILPRFIPEIVDHENELQPALLAACDLGHPVYDLIYLKVASRLGLVLVTADNRFLTKLRGTAFATPMVHLKDWRASA
jgi:predicted nucleic acid-binding protein